MYVEIMDGFLDKNQLVRFNSVYEQGKWVDGEISGPKDKEKKHNLQNEDYDVKRLINQEIHKLFRQISGFYNINKASDVLILKYEKDMHYNDHVDYMMMHGIRTDYTCVLNLNDDYEGGEHYIKNHKGEKTLYKLKAGDMMMYDTSQIHGVNPVIEGERRTLTFWCESAVADIGMREALVRFNVWYHKLTDDDYDALGYKKWCELDWIRMQIMRNHVHYRD